MARGSGKRAMGRATSMPPQSKEEMTKYIILLAENAKPLVLQKNIQKFAPQIATFVLFFKFQVVPLLIQISEFIQENFEKVKPYYYKYQLDELLPAFGGLVMCFFGGEFPLLIVAVESFLVTSWKSVKDVIHDMMEEYHRVVVEEEQEKKNEKPAGENEDDESDAALYQRKFLLALRVLNPDKCTKALTVCIQAFIVVLGAVKLTFVRALSLGAAIGHMAKHTVAKHVTPKLVETCPEEYRKWVPISIDYFCTIMAVLFAFFMQRIISAVHSAMRGARLFVKNTLVYLDKRGYIKFNKNESNMDEIASWALAAFGFLFQLWNGFSVGFPLNLLLFPVTVSEFILTCVVAIF